MFLILASAASAQRDFNDSVARSRNTITRHAMTVLGGWGAANIATGFIFGGTAQGEAKYAWQMNAYWGLINGGLGAMGYFGALKSLRRRYSFSDNMVAQQKIEKIYVLNLGLDLVYMTAGLYLRERGRRETKESSRDRFRGYGTSFLVQGGFLALMDASMILLHHRNTLRVNRKLRDIDLGAGPGQVSLRVSW